MSTSAFEVLSLKGEAVDLPPHYAYAYCGILGGKHDILNRWPHDLAIRYILLAYILNHTPISKTRSLSEGE